MNYSNLAARIEREVDQKSAVQNYANALMSSPDELLKIIEAWVDGAEPDFTFGEISLSLIREKENCSYFQALLKMQLIMSNPAIAAGYLRWRPVNKDVRR